MTKTKDHLYKIENIDFSYSLGNQKIEAIRSLSLTIPSQSLITISGPSGSGKSTLLNILGLIEPIQKGTVLFKNENLSTMSNKDKNLIRKYKIGFIFQQFHLMPVLTAEENVMFFLSRQKIGKEEAKARAQESLEAVGLWEHRKKRPSEMSGGQKQRVAIARALAKNPEVVIGDEVTANLDQATGKEIMSILRTMATEKNVSVILTTHDAMVQSFADHNIHLIDGRLVDYK